MHKKYVLAYFFKLFVTGSSLIRKYPVHPVAELGFSSWGKGASGWEETG